MNQSRITHENQNGIGHRAQTPYVKMSKIRSQTAHIPLYIFAIPTFGLAVTAYGYYSCLEEVPFTKRKRLLGTRIEWEQKQGDLEYKRMLKQFQPKILPENHRACMTVKRVGSRLAHSARLFEQKYAQKTGPGSTSSSSSHYTFTVVKSDMANAFVLPNNHVFLFTGLFQFVKDEDELAAIIGHEMAHNLLRHFGERVSQNFFLSIIALASLMIDPSGTLLSYFVMPTTKLIHELPHSRENEREADYIGMLLAADSCYDPRASKRVFQQLKKLGEGKTPPEFLSTHPSYETRLDLLNEKMPEALSTFKNSNSEGGFGSGLNCNVVRKQMKQMRLKAHKDVTSMENRNKLRGNQGQQW